MKNAIFCAALLTCIWQLPTSAIASLEAVSGDRAKTVTYEGRKAERFELRSGDCYWDREGKNSRDCKTGRERVERRLSAFDNLDQTVCYSFSLLLPQEYGEMRPKSTLGQWHDTKYGDAISLRYMQGRMWLSHNIGENQAREITVPFKKGQWNDFTFRLRPSHKKGEIQVWLGGKKVVNLTDIRTLPGNLKRWYFKYGIYRSHLQGVSNKPTQVAYYSNVSRFSGDKCNQLQ